MAVEGKPIPLQDEESENLLKLPSSLRSLFLSRTSSRESDRSNVSGTSPPAITVIRSPPKFATRIKEQLSIKGSIKDEWQMFSGDAQDYELQLPIGYGASAVVYKAMYKPLGQLCAVKVINVDKMPLDGIDRLRRFVFALKCTYSIA